MELKCNSPSAWKRGTSEAKTNYCILRHFGKLRQEHRKGAGAEPRSGKRVLLPYYIFLEKCNSWYFGCSGVDNQALAELHFNPIIAFIVFLR
jgi:hypothetical protein